jgi:hypothetical protein
MFELARERIEKKSTRAFNAKSELYQLIRFYSVFQGVVLTAVAQSTTIHSAQCWGPASLSLLASLVTVASVHFKLRSYSKLRCSLDKEEGESKVCISFAGERLVSLRAFKKEEEEGRQLEMETEIQC